LPDPLSRIAGMGSSAGTNRRLGALPYWRRWVTESAGSVGA